MKKAKKATLRHTSNPMATDDLPGSPKPIPGRCGSELRNSRKKYGMPRYHTAYPMKGKTRCRIHGGETPTGPASTHWKTGEHPRHFPPNLLERFKFAAADPELFNLKRDIATVEVLIDEQINQLEGQSLEDFAASWDGLRVAMAKKDTAQMNQRMQEIDGFRQNVGTVSAALRQVVVLTDQRRKLIETHFKNMAASASALSDAEAAALFAALTAAVRQEVRDDQILGRIEVRFTRLVWC